MAEKNTKEAIASLLKELNTVKNDVTIGRLSFKELTYEQQRKIVPNNSSISDIIASIRNTLNEYIKQNVEFVDDVVKTDMLTLDVRPFVLNVLAAISMGKEIKIDDKNYTLYEVQPEDLEKHLQPEVYKKDTFELVIDVPTIKEDTIYNALLMNALSQYKNKQVRNLSDPDAVSITALYGFYENMKYIKSFTINGTTYNFIELSTQDKINLLNQFPQKIISLINRYRKQVDKLTEKAFTATNVEDGSVQKIDSELQLFMVENDEI